MVQIWYTESYTNNCINLEGEPFAYEKSKETGGLLHRHPDRFLGAPILFFGFDSVTLMSLTLFVLFPLVCLICGILCGRENGLHLHYPILVALLFLPTIFLFYDSSVWPFWVTYIMIAFIGVAIGYFIQRGNSNTNSKGRLR